VINGGHNWPTPGTHGNPPVATHFDATQEIVEDRSGYPGSPASAVASIRRSPSGLR
jgi:hypothetical protein